MSLSDIPRITYSDFTGFHRKIRGARVPADGSLEITARCNLRCAHCYVTTPWDRPRTDELGLSELRRVMDEIADAGCLFLLITGGEPLLRDDFLDIYTYALRKGFILTLFSNATLIDERVADAFLDMPPSRVEVTIYGATRETYERVTGVAGSFERCLRGIRLLLEREIPLELKTMVMTLNRHETSQMRDLAGSMGVEFRLDPVINAHIDQKLFPVELRLSPADSVDVLMDDPRDYEAWLEYGERCHGPIESESLYYCAAGLNSFHIDSRGRLQLCIVSRVPSYDLRSGSFLEGWNEFLPGIRDRKRTKETGCTACDLVALCDTCPGTAEMEHGDKEKPVDYYCQVAHERARRLNQLESHGPHGRCAGGADGIAEATDGRQLVTDGQGRDP